MKTSIQDKIKLVEGQIRICNIISVTAIVVTLLLVGAEYVTARFFADAQWAHNMIKMCIYTLYIMPFVIVVPMFFKVNLRNKLYQLKKKG